MIGEIEWDWPQPHGKSYKIILNPKHGTLEVLNSNGETIIRKTNLSKRQITYIYQNLQNRLKNQENSTDLLRPDRSYDPMIN